ncbi:unnamed protein product [Blepharisma stoltei]|uniref:Uncharacterized protein n=1 Tax=Blepharisma stoltei TaxID=1481888 RepID=A0AAU9IF48_9CILI|nr:unnamed protein product [Blepharisma stoltei]
MFSAGIKSTSRVKSMNALLKRVMAAMKRRNNAKILIAFEEILADEDEAIKAKIYNQLHFYVDISFSRFLKEFSKFYTMYFNLIFAKEYKNLINLHAITKKHDKFISNWR